MAVGPRQNESVAVVPYRKPSKLSATRYTYTHNLNIELSSPGEIKGVEATEQT